MASPLSPNPAMSKKPASPSANAGGNRPSRLGPEHLQALRDGQYAALDIQEEYVVFLRFEQHKELGYGR